MRYSWSKPNPFFLPALAAARLLCSSIVPPTISSSSTKRYADPDELARLVADDRARDWAQCTAGRIACTASTIRTSRPCSLGCCRTLRPRTASSVRNPHFHRVDQRGQQLPYIDKVLLGVVDAS